VTPLVVGSALNPINSSVIATALVPIAAALQVPVGRTLILVSSLYLACAIAQPTAGKLAEEFGPAGSFWQGLCWCCSAVWSAATPKLCLAAGPCSPAARFDRLADASVLPSPLAK
jgi:MFS family permease